MNKAKLLKAYPNKIELHLHTSPASLCARVSPEAIVEKYHALGFNAITLTNHIDPNSLKFTEDDFVKRYLSDYDRAVHHAEKFGMRVYLGAEVRFLENNNDYLVYGLDEALLRECYRHIDKGIEAFYKALKTEDNVIVQAHPFRDGMTLDYTQNLDGIEVFNMAAHNSRIAFAARFHEENKGVILGGNDLHYEYNYPIFSTHFSSLPKDSIDLAKAILKRDYIFSLGESVILP